MMILKWNPEKNIWLKEHRGISFEVVAEFVAERKIIDIIDDVTNNIISFLSINY